MKIAVMRTQEKHLPLRATLLVGLISPNLASVQAADGGKMENVISVTTDDLQWQEVFGGVDPAVMNKPAGGGAGTNAFARDFGREIVEARSTAHQRTKHFRRSLNFAIY